MGGGYREGPSVHVFASGANETADLVNRVGSGRDFRAQKPHERLLAVGSEGQDIVRPRRSTFHTGRSGGHARDRKSQDGRALCEEPSDRLRGHVALDDEAGHFRGVAGG